VSFGPSVGIVICKSNGNSATTDLYVVPHFSVRHESAVMTAEPVVAVTVKASKTSPMA
jgi:hypothetical protein